ncbi:hypothetical protein PMAYCL1PPCAC_15345, partial [Pristionchus mayeri]
QYSASFFGTYKHLLTAFTVADIFLVILHEQRTVLVGTTHGVVTDTIFDDRRITAFYIAFQSVPFIILVIHFLYRYWSVRHPNLVALFSRKSFIILLANATFGSAMAW